MAITCKVSRQLIDISVRIGLAYSTLLRYIVTYRTTSFSSCWLRSIQS